MKLHDLLKKRRSQYYPIFKPDLEKDNTFILDFSGRNKDLDALSFSDTLLLDKYVFGKLTGNGAIYGYGGYMEDREVYRRSPLFAGSQEKARSVHLGIDVWTEKGKEIFLPLNGRVHGFQNNKQFGDYGPTIIMEHQLEDVVFYTLYGHLDLDSLNGLKIGMPFKAGDLLGRVGSFPVNGDWPPHLHFQIIGDLMGNKGDFPGVCLQEEKEYYRKICPDPGIFFPKLS